MYLKIGLSAQETFKLVKAPVEYIHRI